MVWLVLFLIINLIFAFVVWFKYFQERKKYLMAQTIINDLQNLSLDWQNKTAIWKESAQVWKEASETWQETAETYQRSADKWRDLYLQTEETYDGEEYIN